MIKKKTKIKEKNKNKKLELVILMFVDALILSSTTGVKLNLPNSVVNGAKETPKIVSNVKVTGASEMI